LCTLRDNEIRKTYVSSFPRRQIGYVKTLGSSSAGLGVEMKYERHYYPSYEEVKGLCEHINLDDPAPFITRGKHVSWRQFMTLLMDRSRREITNIYAVSHLLDTDYLALLMAVEECPHFDFLQMGGYLLLPNLSFFAADQIYDYTEKVRALEQYSERTFSG
jgi:hypothetical protein